MQSVCEPTFLLIHLLEAGFLLGRFSTLKMEVICSSETSVHIRTPRLYIPKYGKIHCQRIEHCAGETHFLESCPEYVYSSHLSALMSVIL
jgi:hypothetical protein